MHILLSSKIQTVKLISIGNSSGFANIWTSAEYTHSTIVSNKKQITKVSKTMFELKENCLLMKVL